MGARKDSRTSGPNPTLDSFPHSTTVLSQVANLTHIPIDGPVTLDVMFEVFNLFNRTNFTDVNNVFGIGPFPEQPLPNYGVFTAAGPPRQIQLSGRLSF